MRKADGAQRCDEHQAGAFGKRRGGRRHESGSGHDGVPKTLTRRSLQFPANTEADASSQLDDTPGAPIGVDPDQASEDDAAPDSHSIVPERVSPRCYAGTRQLDCRRIDECSDPHLLRSIVTHDSSHHQGLTSAEAARRLHSGYNELPSAKPRGLLSIAWEFVREPMFLLLIGASVIYLFLGDMREALVLFASVFVV